MASGGTLRVMPEVGRLNDQTVPQQRLEFLLHFRRDLHVQPLLNRKHQRQPATVLVVQEHSFFTQRPTLSKHAVHLVDSRPRKGGDLRLAGTVHVRHHQREVICSPILCERDPVTIHDLPARCWHAQCQSTRLSLRLPRSIQVLFYLLSRLNHWRFFLFNRLRLKHHLS